MLEASLRLANGFLEMLPMTGAEGSLGPTLAHVSCMAGDAPPVVRAPDREDNVAMSERKPPLNSRFGPQSLAHASGGLRYLRYNVFQPSPF